MRQVYLLAVAFLAAYSPSEENAAIVLYDPGYAIEIVLDKEDGISSPDGLWWHDGMLHIADEGGSAIRRWDGNTLVTLADASSGIASPEDLIVDSAGQVWFTDDTAGGLWRVTQDGAARVAGTDDIAESEGIGLRRDGLVWVGDGRTGRVHAFERDGRRAGPVAGAWKVAKPESMAVAPNGALWLADNRDDRLLRIEVDGTAHEWLLPDDLSPESLAMFEETLWITDSQNGRLYRLRKGQEPEIVALFVADFVNINGVATAPAGVIYVSIHSNLAASEGYLVRMVPAAPAESSN